MVIGIVDKYELSYQGKNSNFYLSLPKDPELLDWRRNWVPLRINLWKTATSLHYKAGWQWILERKNWNILGLLVIGFDRTLNSLFFIPV